MSSTPQAGYGQVARSGPALTDGVERARIAQIIDECAHDCLQVLADLAKRYPA